MKLADNPLANALDAFIHSHLRAHRILTPSESGRITFALSEIVAIVDRANARYTDPIDERTCMIADALWRARNDTVACAEEIGVDVEDAEAVLRMLMVRGRDMYLARSARGRRKKEPPSA